MTELKRICPFCGGEMIGSNGHPICHYNPDCIIYDESVPQELLDILADTKKKLDEIKSDIDEMIAQSHDIGERFAEVILCNLKNKIKDNDKEQQ